MAEGGFQRERSGGGSQREKALRESDESPGGRGKRALTTKQNGRRQTTVFELGLSFARARIIPIVILSTAAIAECISRRAVFQSSPGPASSKKNAPRRVFR